jgi:hypothetical protein
MPFTWFSSLSSSRARRHAGGVTLLLAAVFLAAHASAQSPPEQTVPRVMDAWTGILFVCQPTSSLKWSGEACNSIGRAALRRATASGIKLFIVQPGHETEAVSHNSASEAGFDAAHALLVTAAFLGPEERGALPSLSFVARANTGIDTRNKQPPASPVFNQIALLEVHGKRRAAEKAALLMIDALFDKLSRPR